ncbi:DUF6461 domain-containing protein [Dactylosporangium sp. NPDC049140]|uniref:DUF6461 domain-containing protein n=1 Tax=Dactylosporangium sp. NPDC049140 TaxID=3155647 RepID=UPI003402C09A
MHDLAALAVRTIPAIVELVPPGPAGALGRLNAPEDPSARPRTRPGRPGPGVDELTAERLLGALERFVARHDWTVEANLAGEEVQRPPRAHQYGFATIGGESAALAAARRLDGFRKGVADHIAALVRALAADPAVAPLLAVAGEAEGGEAAIAAAHGAVHIALGVAVAGAVVHQVDPPGFVDAAAATVGLGLGAAARLLRETPVPAAYAGALLAKVRAEYLLPRRAGGSVQVRGHRFALAERDLPGEADFSATGIVAGTDGGAIVRTGIAEGWLRVTLVVLAEPPAPFPDEPADGWDWEEVAEVSWHAAEGHAALGSLGRQTPPWPGDYRVRVYASGRDDGDAEFEHHRLVVWAAPAAPPILWRSTDRVGHRLRGEPEPERVRGPEYAYRWLRRSELRHAATVTVVTGATAADVVRAFGGDPDGPEPLRDDAQDQVMVLDAGDAVLAVENNGYAGSHREVLVAASAGGRAASMYWNVNGLTRLSFAERGRILAQHEPWGREEWPQELDGVLDGLDFARSGERPGKGLVAVERFAGRGIGPEDLARLRAAGVGYRAG